MATAWVALLVVLSLGLVVQALFLLIRASAIPRRPEGRPFTPPVTIIVPCKGLDPFLEKNLESILRQEYPWFQVVFSTASAQDRAVEVLDRLIASAPHARRVVAGHSTTRGEKVNNLLAALGSLPGRTGSDEVLVFADSDIWTHPTWLIRLVRPLADPSVSAATAYRWYFSERNSFWTDVTAIWNGLIGSFLAFPFLRFAWGGSMAIRREPFERLQIPRIWENAVADDVSLSAALRRAGLAVAFVPDSIVLTRENRSGFKRMLEWTTRQTRIAFVYFPRIWYAGALFSAGTLAASGAAALLVSPWFLLLPIGGYMIAGYLIVEANERVVRRGFPPIARRKAPRRLIFYSAIAALVLGSLNIVLSLASRRIRWRGIVYDIPSPERTIVLRIEDGHFQERRDARAEAPFERRRGERRMRFDPLGFPERRKTI